MSVTAAKGFAASGVAVGIRRRERLDLAVVRSLSPAVGAAMFTRNKVQAACLQVCRENLELAEPQAVVINSGVANAATGERGVLDALATTAEAGRLMNLMAEEVLPSPGAMAHACRCTNCCPRLRSTRRRTAALMRPEAIMTTDTKPKVAAAKVQGSRSRNGAGLGSIRSATMLRSSHRYPAERGAAIEFCGRRRAASTRSRWTEPSTNDCVILLANGLSGAKRDDAAFAAALNEVCADLARQVVADGEGMTVLAEINVTGAVDNEQAKAIARRIATSPLVKTALFGHDANWGRVLMAAGSAPWNGGYASVDANQITLRYNGTVVLDHGTPTDVEPDVSGPSCTIDLELGLGSGHAGYLTSDLSYDYVRINADYRT